MSNNRVVQKNFRWNRYRCEIGFGAGVLLAMITWNLPLEGLPPQGQKCLALSLMTVVFWAMKVAHSGYVSGLYLVSLILFKIAPAEKVFAPWTSSTIYLVAGAYLIAAAVNSSGLGKRIAYKFILKFVSSYRSVIISTFMLTFMLSLIIPHPWPRAFLIMSVMGVVIKSANLPREDGAKIGLTVFACSVPVSTIFLTGDSTINILAVNFSGQELSWLGWFYQMGIPGIIASILTCLLILSLFKPSGPFHIDKSQINKSLKDLGQFTMIEKRTMIWISIAIVLWMTDAVHGIDLGWVTLFVAMSMSMPVIGEVLTPKDWGQVPLQVLFFLTAAIAIGKIGGFTGMNGWIASVVLPSSVPSNPFILAMMITGISICLHMMLGSVIAVMGIAIPALLVFTQNAELNPLVPVLLVYSSIAIHYIFPFHHLNMLVGLGEENGMYTDGQVMQLGIPLTVVVFIITVMVEIPWWKLTGLL